MTCSLGLVLGVVRVVGYDECWPAAFAVEVQRISDVCPALMLRFEHIGSTAVVGLCAKPIIDLLAGYSPETPAVACVGPLQQAGYVHMGEFGIAGRAFFRHGDPPAFHLHLVEHGGTLWNRYVAFRDFLRTHPDAVRQYAQLKRSLAARFPEDRDAYMQGKVAFVQQVLSEALGAA